MPSAPENKPKQKWAIVGALIVFGTFVIKDGIRDHVKDSVEAIDNAETGYLVRNDISWSLPDVKSIEETVNKLDTRTDRTKKLSMGQLYMQSPNSLQLPASIDVLSTVAFDLDNSQRLLEALPDRYSLEHDLKRLDDKWKELNDEYGSIQAVLQQADLPYLTKDDISKLPDAQAFSDREQRFNKDVESLRVASQSFEDGLFIEAERTKAGREHKLLIVTWASYIFYVVGWGLAFYGKWEGIPGLDPSD